MNALQGEKMIRKIIVLPTLYVFLLIFYSPISALGNFNPQWEPKPGQYIMGIYGQAYIDQKLIDQEGYIIGAFGDGNVDDCMGTAEFVRLNDEWVFFLIIQSDQEVKKIYFKIYYTNTGKEYKLSDHIEFQKDVIQEVNLDVPFKIDSVYPTQELVNTEVTVDIKGAGFDSSTRAAIYPYINENKIIDVQDLPDAKSLCIYDSYLYAAGKDKLTIFKINALKKLDLIKTIQITDANSAPLYIVSICIFQNKLVVASNKGLILLYDLENPINPKIIKNYEIADEIVSIRSHSNYLYVLCGDEGLKRVDIKDLISN